MDHVDLFSGIGGFALAAAWAGFRTVQFVEIDPYCQKVLNKNFPGVPVHDDVTTYSGHSNRGCALLTGGFPCQDISAASSDSDAPGIYGERSGLFFEQLRIIRECEPAWVVLENVYLLSSRGLDECLSCLEAANYTAWAVVLGAGNVGAPHKRRRFFVVAYANKNGQPALPKHDEARILLPPAGYLGLPEAQTLGLRVDDGVSDRLDRARLGALGNAVSPQQVYPVLKWIAEVAA